MNNPRVNLPLILSYNPCQSGLDNLNKHYPNVNLTLSKFLRLEHVPYNDKIWLVTKVTPVEILKQWSVECADLVLNNYEDSYPNDNRIRECISVTKAYLLGEASLEQLNAAGSAARSAAGSAESAATYAAWSAESAASAAAYAAWSARSAAESAASAAWSARSAAGSAARSASSAARSAASSAARSAASSAARSAASAEKEQEGINLSVLIALLEN